MNKYVDEIDMNELIAQLHRHYKNIDGLYAYGMWTNEKFYDDILITLGLVNIKRNEVSADFFNSLFAGISAPRHIILPTYKGLWCNKIGLMPHYKNYLNKHIYNLMLNATMPSNTEEYIKLKKEVEKQWINKQIHIQRVP